MESPKIKDHQKKRIPIFNKPIKNMIPFPKKTIPKISPEKPVLFLFPPKSARFGILPPHLFYHRTHRTEAKEYVPPKPPGMADHATEEMRQRQWQHPQLGRKM